MEFTLPEDDFRSSIEEDGSLSMAANTQPFLLDSAEKRRRESKAFRVVHHRSIWTRMAPCLTTMQLLGLYPLPLGSKLVANFCEKYFWNYKTFLWAITGLYLMLNAACAYVTIRVVHVTLKEHDLMHVQAIASIVTGLKPLVNVVHFVIFALFARQHKRLLKQMQRMERDIYVRYGRTPNTLLLNIVFLLLCVVASLLSLGMRVMEHKMMNDKLFVNWMSDVSFMLVPLLTLWNAVPLIYFCTLNNFGFAVITTRYKAICSCDAEISASIITFNPFVCFTVLWTMWTLCLSLYFITQLQMKTTHVVSSDPEGNGTNSTNITSTFLVNITHGHDINGTDMGMLDRVNGIYCAFQVGTATIYLLALCAIGAFTNETARQILSSVLEVKLKPADRLSRFQVVCFIHKVETQHHWGLSVWWAIPMERNMMFTLLSAILTYTLLLLKLKGGDGDELLRRVCEIVLPVLTNKSAEACVGGLTKLLMLQNETLT